MTTQFETFLSEFDETAWDAALDSLGPEIHEVDRTATRIWFRFYPLALFRYLQQAEDRDKALQKFVMQGRFELKDQLDSSHAFLYGHRFWREVKAAIEARAADFAGDRVDLVGEIKQLSATIAGTVKKDASLLIGITATGLMTLVQTGSETFRNSPGTTAKPSGLMNNSPEKIVAARARDDSQGLFGFLRTVDKQFTVVYDETRDRAKFRIFDHEEIASASARDQSQNWRENDERCIEGVIPVECRSAACGTCWVGVLAGAEKLSDVAPRERKQMKVFGYYQGNDAKPFMRLSCQAQAIGNVHLVIPPWNGVFGKKIYGNVEESELEPATTSAVKLRETIKSGVSDK